MISVKESVERLPDKARLIWDIIVEYKRNNSGNSPTLRKIARIAEDHGVEMTATTVMMHINKHMGDLVLREKSGLVVVGGRWDLDIECSSRE